MIVADPKQVAEVRRMTGLPWSEDGLGPDTFHCWGVLYHMYQLFLDKQLRPYSSIDPRNTQQITTAIEKGTDCLDWKRIQNPTHFCGVALSRNKKFHHVGLFLDWDAGYVLHAAEGGTVLCPTLASVRMAWNRIEFYKHNG